MDNFWEIWSIVVHTVVGGAMLFQVETQGREWEARKAFPLLHTQQTAVLPNWRLGAKLATFAPTSISPKLFWMCPNCFGHIQIVLDTSKLVWTGQKCFWLDKKQLFTTEFNILNCVQNVWSGPKQFGESKTVLGL